MIRFRCRRSSPALHPPPSQPPKPPGKTPLPLRVRWSAPFGRSILGGFFGGRRFACRLAPPPGRGLRFWLSRPLQRSPPPTGAAPPVVYCVKVLLLPGGRGSVLPARPATARGLLLRSNGRPASPSGELRPPAGVRSASTSLRAVLAATPQRVGVPVGGLCASGCGLCVARRPRSPLCKGTARRGFALRAADCALPVPWQRLPAGCAGGFPPGPPFFRPRGARAAFPQVAILRCASYSLQVHLQCKQAPRGILCREGPVAFYFDHASRPGCISVDFLWKIRGNLHPSPLTSLQLCFTIMDATGNRASAPPLTL